MAASSTLDMFTQRIIGALRLDEETYEQIEADTTATGQAAFVVVGSGLVAAAGNVLLRGGELNGGILVAIAQLVGWALNAWVAYLIGTKLIPGPQTRSTWGEVAGRGVGAGSDGRRAPVSPRRQHRSRHRRRRPEHAGAARGHRVRHQLHRVNGGWTSRPAS